MNNLDQPPIVNATATVSYLQAFADLQEQMEAFNGPKLEAEMPKGANQASLLQNRQYPLAMRLAQAMETSTQKFFDGISNLPAEGVDPNAIRLIALWRYQAHLVLTSIRAYGSVVLAQSTYRQNYTFGPAFLLSLIGLGGSYRSAETSQRAICDKAFAEWKDGENQVATNMRMLQMEAEQLVATLQQQYLGL